MHHQDFKISFDTFNKYIVTSTDLAKTKYFTLMDQSKIIVVKTLKIPQYLNVAQPEYSMQLNQYLAFPRELLEQTEIGTTINFRFE